jgi:translation initiation factor 1A
MLTLVTVGKKLIKNESDIQRRFPLPDDYSCLGVVKKNLGYSRMRVKCSDGEQRLCRIRGKMKKRNWVREGDIVLVSPWEFQSDEKGDIIFRYTSGQSHWLRRKGFLNLG